MKPTRRLEELNLNLLVALDALLEEQNVTRAARRSGVSQSAMSRSLASLRELFDDELLVRVGNVMHVTPLADSLAPRLRACLLELQQLLQAGGPFDPTQATGVFRLATAGHLAALLVPGLLREIDSLAPALTLRIDQLDTAKIRSALDQGADVVVGPALDAGASVSSRVLFRDDLACLIRRPHPSFAGERLSVKQYLDFDHVLISPTGRGASAVDDALADLGLSRRVSVRVQAFLLAPALVAQTDLMLTAPRSSLLGATRLLPVQILPSPLPLGGVRIAVYWDIRRDEDKRTQWMIDMVARSLRHALEPPLVAESR